ncbi:hypothetical protein PHISCL_09985 [Aspergillus sclerotialis]|uniref:Uncharacterized protein n=1 Tax=Aspergillus sclerotialis TaxID=2070753 RepID=A0A3A2Z3M9_9EURO|nr:hypothetical protein PHISCL_09985 [Aspergillus sclerotialis]
MDMVSYLTSNFHCRMIRHRLKALTTPQQPAATGNLNGDTGIPARKFLAKVAKLGQVPSSRPCRDQKRGLQSLHLNFHGTRSSGKLSANSACGSLYKDSKACMAAETRWRIWKEMPDGSAGWLSIKAWLFAAASYITHHLRFSMVSQDETSTDAEL